MRKLYKLNVFFGGCGDIEGLFCNKESEVQAAIGKTVYLGEVLGRHSDVWFTLEEKHLKVISVDQDFINEIEYEFQSTNLCGYNPLNYLTNEQ